MYIFLKKANISQFVLVGACIAIIIGGNRSFNLQAQTKQPAKKPACQYSGTEVAELNRQIGRLNGMVDASNTQTQALLDLQKDLSNTLTSCLSGCQSSADEAAASQCMSSCQQTAQGAQAAAAKSINFVHLSCQSLTDSIHALETTRVNLENTCSISDSKANRASISVCK